MRRTYLFLSICFLLYISCDNKLLPFLDDGTSIHFEKSQKPFYHGVASGDPLNDAVIIWTRVTPEVNKTVQVKWKMATDQQFKNVIKSGKESTSSSKDYTVKVDVKGLKASQTYYYQFEALGGKSIVGRTKTLPKQNPDQVKLAIVSCSNYEAGYFNALGRIGEKDDIDAVLHLGDYIYEYGVGKYGDTTLGRINLPAHEIVKIEDYRTRYALYRLDKDFQKAHQMHPFITIWDDHEITNNSYKDGAQNHQPEEGDYNVRKSIARQVYYEWLPVREGENLYRQFDYGGLVDLIMLDERLAGRSAQADSVNTVAFNDPSRSMLGQTQLDWFFDAMKNSKASWKVIGNQVIFSDLSFENIFPKRPKNLDAWDGYPFEKKKVIQFLKDNQIANTIFVTGDTHCSWAFETPTNAEDYRNNGDQSVVAFEFGTTGVSSPNYDENVGLDTVRMVEGLYYKMNPHLKYVDLSEHGYLLLTLNSDEAKAEWMYVDTVKRRTRNEKVGKTMTVKKDAKMLLN